MSSLELRDHSATKLKMCQVLDEIEVRIKDIETKSEKMQECLLM